MFQFIGYDFTKCINIFNFIGLEFVSPQYRMVVGVVIQMFFSVGFLLTSAFAKAFTNWRYFQLAITLPTLCYMSYYWLVMHMFCHQILLIIIHSVNF